MMQNVAIGNPIRTGSTAGAGLSVDDVWLQHSDQTASERRFKSGADISESFILVFSSDEVNNLLERFSSTGSGMRNLHSLGEQKTNTLPWENSSSPRDVPGMVSEIRRLTGYGWDRIARLLGCTRQAMHKWVSGGKISDENRAKLAQLHAVLRYIDRGLAEETRRVLDRDYDGYTLADMLAEGRFEKVREIAGRGSGRSDKNWTRPRPQPTDLRDHWYERLVAQGEDDRPPEIRMVKPERIESIPLKKEE